MPRTPEQIEADNALTNAIEKVIAVYYPADEAYVLSEYLVLTSQQRWDDDGDGITAVGTILRDSNVPAHRALGLLEFGVTRMRHNITQDTEE